MVFSADEKSQIQALERTQPILPLRPGVPERQTHDYYRHETTTLYATLNAVTEAVIGDSNETHKGEDVIRFLGAHRPKDGHRKDPAHHRRQLLCPQDEADQRV